MMLAGLNMHIVRVARMLTHERHLLVHWTNGLEHPTAGYYTQTVLARIAVMASSYHRQFIRLVLVI